MKSGNTDMGLKVGTTTQKMTIWEVENTYLICYHTHVVPSSCCRPLVTSAVAFLHVVRYLASHLMMFIVGTFTYIFLECSHLVLGHESLSTHSPSITSFSISHCCLTTFQKYLKAACVTHDSSVYSGFMLPVYLYLH